MIASDAPRKQVLCRIEAAGLVECGDVCIGGEDGQAALKLAIRSSLDDYQGGDQLPFRLCRMALRPCSTLIYDV